MVGLRKFVITSLALAGLTFIAVDEYKDYREVKERIESSRLPGLIKHLHQSNLPRISDGEGVRYVIDPRSPYEHKTKYGLFLTEVKDVPPLGIPSEGDEVKGYVHIADADLTIRRHFWPIRERIVAKFLPPSIDISTDKIRYQSPNPFDPSPVFSPTTLKEAFYDSIDARLAK